MSGLDKIIGHIRSEAETEVKAVADAAKAEAETLKADMEAKTKAECDRIAKKSETEVQNILERGESSAALRKKQILLQKKQELINEIIAQAREKLLGLDDAAYFEVLKQLFAKNMLGRDGEIAFNEKDLARLPQNVVSELSKLAGEKGGSIALAKTAAPIDGGFVLNYGGIEENCSFQALIDDSIEVLQDQVQKVLFA